MAKSRDRKPVSFIAENPQKINGYLNFVFQLRLRKITPNPKPKETPLGNTIIDDKIRILNMFS